jgi:hypothetical protein
MLRVVYFAQDSRGGEVHIGLATYRKLDKHLENLQAGNPAQLKLLGIIQARNAAALVRELWATFSDARVRGSWFRPVPDLMDYIQQRAVRTAHHS